MAFSCEISHTSCTTHILHTPPLNSDVRVFLPLIRTRYQFYTTMALVSSTRMLILKRFSALPLKYVPFVSVPFLIGYQIDFAWGSKANRINKQAKHIREEENHHWFNQPLDLPPTLKPVYREYMDALNKELFRAGLPPEKEWAR